MLLSFSLFLLLLIWVDHEQVNPLLHLPVVGLSLHLRLLTCQNIGQCAWDGLVSARENKSPIEQFFYASCSRFYSLSLLCVRLTLSLSLLESSVSCIHSFKCWSMQVMPVPFSCPSFLYLAIICSFYFFFSRSLSFSLSFVLHLPV